MKKATTNLTQQLATLKEKISALTESNHAYEQQQQQQAEAAQAASYKNSYQHSNNSQSVSTGSERWDYSSGINPDGSSVGIVVPDELKNNNKLKEGYLPYR